MVAFADFALIRRWRATFPTPGKALIKIPPVVAFAHFALIRRWRATFPTRGKASSGCAKSFSFYFSILLLNRHCIYRLRTAEVAFPRVGKVAPQATDEGETGERDHTEHTFLLCKIFFILLLNPAFKSALYLSVTNRRTSLPPGGEGGAAGDG